MEMQVSDWEKEAAKEISQFVAELVRQWVEFRGHEEAIAAIIAKHARHPRLP
jgi:hypothetical protein